MTWFKNIVFAALLALLCLPLVQRFSNWVEVKPLEGAFETVPEATFGLEQWVNNSFQQEFERHFEHHLGFRPIFIRTYNQYLFSGYHSSKTFVVPGKDDQLFAYDYFMAYSGQLYIGRDSIRKNYQNLLRLQRDLKENLNIPMLLVIAPNKARLKHSQLPNDLNMPPADSSNYNVWLEYLKQDSIPYLDFNALFAQHYAQGGADVFPNTGTHWNSYGMTLALDTIFERLYQLNDSAAMPSFDIGEPFTADSLVDPDRDLARGINLLWPPQTLPQTFVKTQLHPRVGSGKVKALIVGDSFFWNLYSLNCFTALWDKETRYWYYNNTQMLIEGAERIPVPELKALERLREVDFVIIMGTESNLHKLPYGFPEKFFAEADTL